ncbi:defective proboscis extension response 13 isoform 2-T3 [Glossina fuscipes fuscipes]
MHLNARIQFQGILHNLFRTSLLIVFSLMSFDSGYSSYVRLDAKKNEEMSWNVKKDMIMIPDERFTANFPSSMALVSTLPRGHHRISTYTTSLPISLQQEQLHHLPQSEYEQPFQPNSASSITSFDSSTMDDSKQSKQIIETQRSNNRILTRSTHIVAHKVIGIGLPSVQERIDVNSSAEDSNDIIFNEPMHFGTENSTVVTTQIGAAAHIPCTVHHIGDGVVSWIRKKDYHLLTVGLTTYSSDERFSATHLKHSEDWTLQIKYVQSRDAGIYECQVSTHPPTSIFLHLNVVEARAEISGPSIRYLTPGSTLRLLCRVVQNTEISEYIFWYHDNRMINYDIDRGINVSTEPDFQSSELMISRTRREHSGNYTCVASNTQPASVLVHIFKGDNPAAMYHGHVGSSTKSCQNVVTFFVIIGFRIFHMKIV